MSEAEEEIASAFALPELPTVEEQIRAIEEPMAALYAGEIAIPSDVVDEVLRSGSNRDRSQLRLIYNFMIDQTPEEYAEFVKQEYRTGGKGLVIGGQEYSAWFDELGMQIAVGHTINDKVLSKAFLSWEDVSGRIGQLLRQGEYAPQAVLDAARGNALMEHAQALAYMERDLAEGVSELVFEDTDIFRGGFPDVEERLSGLLAQSAFLTDLNERLEGLAEVYQEDSSVMRFHIYRPDKVLAQFQKFAKEAVPYQARDGFAWQEHDRFITQDEIDAFLSGGGPYSDGRLSTYAFFVQEHSDGEKAEFLKERYGTGGSSHALSGADDSHADYDAKGLVLARGGYGSPYASVLMKWPKVAQRVDYLIKQEKFLKPADYSRMADYEREQMAGRVIRFYNRLPQEIARPLQEGFFPDKMREELTEILLDGEKTQELLSEMNEALAALPLDFDRYEERAQTLSELIQYSEGTFTIFPEKKKEVEFASGHQISIFDFFGMENQAEPELTAETETMPEAEINTSAEQQSEESVLAAGMEEETMDAPEGQQPEPEKPEVIARYQSTSAMQVGYVENIAILQYPNGSFYNHYGYDEERGMGAASAGPFDTLEDARQTVLAHRPDAQEIGVQTVEKAEPSREGKPIQSEKQDLQPLLQDAADEYNSIKERYPNSLVGFEQHGRYEFYGEDAKLV
ncbi:MAG: hypothetical protein LUE24_00050, partial [Lachnospiraceae bacterium]|nr:hypothetical protein [Lachnospiraceae bacterium]